MNTIPNEDYERAAGIEWLDVDRLGGYASGTAAGLPTRRFHALLLVAEDPPHERIVLVNHLTELLETSSGPLALSTRGKEAPEDGWRRCVAFTTNPFPTWTYDLGDGFVVERSVLRLAGRPTACVRWRLVASPSAAPVRVRVRPMLTGRKDHDVQKKHDGVDEAAVTETGHVSWKPHEGFPRVHVHGRASYEHAPTWTCGVTYPIAHDRGEAWREDWWSPGELTVELSLERSTTLAFSTEREALDADAAFEEESKRRLLAAPTSAGSGLFDVLRKAASCYEVDTGKSSAVVAGFPWFDVWTRDTFTAFTGIFLATGRHAEGRKVLATFAPLVRHGMLPANLPDSTTKARWNAADASFWFIICIGRYLHTTGDASIVDEFAWKAVRAIVEGHLEGAPPHIRVDDDGLVYASAPDQALTWMDADYEGKIMTPRRGKPVEIQALWVAALRVSRELAEQVGDDAFAARCGAAREAAIASFRARFWNAAKGYLYDVVDGPDGDDPTLRPNQLFAVALDDALVPLEHARSIVAVAREKLLTPFGLRTLAVDDPNYHPRYEGDQSERDPAYHQGSVWPYLFGPFCVAWMRVHGSTERARSEVAGFLRPIEAHLETDGCLGHMAEIYDGSAPHRARGCFAQAWSVGEILATLLECGLASEPEKT